MYNPCDNCGGEDCVCCEVWHERQADLRYQNSYENPEWRDYWGMNDEDEEEYYED